MRGHAQDNGFSLIEVMIAMVISGIAFMGAIGAVQISSGQTRQGALNSRALELAQARLEVKHSVRWPHLLEDDLDGAAGAHDGDLGGGPGVVDVAPEVLGAHDAVGAAVGLAGDDGELGDRRLGIGGDALGPVAGGAG